MMQNPEPSFRGARPSRASPESITTIRGYGFRACAQRDKLTSSICARGASRNDGSCEFRRRHDLGPGGLMHRGVGGVRDPGLLVDEGNPPAAMAGAGQVIQPRDRAIVDGERQALARLVAERKPDRRLDGAAMRD